jgi:hypothetical protein
MEIACYRRNTCEKGDSGASTLSVEYHQDANLGLAEYPSGTMASDWMATKSSGGQGGV